MWHIVRTETLLRHGETDGIGIMWKDCSGSVSARQWEIEQERRDGRLTATSQEKSPFTPEMIVEVRSKRKTGEIADVLCLSFGIASL